MARYCRALIEEIRHEGRNWRGERVSTVFLGGGTPSVIPPARMGEVLDALCAAFAIDGEAEFTSEANPGTLTVDWLSCVKAHGLNRLSLGVQAVQEPLLRSLGRIHTFRQAQEAFDMARKAGITNLNADLMFALPGQSLEDYRESIQAVCAMEPKHISAYSLIVEEGTPLCREVEAGRVQPPDDDAAADFYQLGLETLDALGYHQYEISNFAMEGFACRHNIGYWQGAWYLGLGVSAHGMLPAEMRATAVPTAELGAAYIRRANTSDMAAYVSALLEGALPPRETQAILRDEAMFEAIMLGLRMNRGVDAAAFQRRFGVTLEAAYAVPLRSLVQDGIGGWDAQSQRFALTPRGMLVQNEALLRFMNKC